MAVRGWISLYLPGSFAFFLFISACSVAPSEGAAQDVITRHFESRQYRVIEIALGEIEATPLGKRKYMTPRGYHIPVLRLTLEVTRDIGDPWQFSKGQRISFTNASVIIHESSHPDRQWDVAGISGIAVP